MVRFTFSADSSRFIAHFPLLFLARAGVGVVQGSDPSSEWQELELKVRQYDRLLQSRAPVAAAPNINLAWAGLMVEELCRLGVNTFCVAPGSRSSALTMAVALHPRCASCLSFRVEYGMVLAVLRERAAFLGGVTVSYADDTNTNRQ